MKNFVPSKFMIVLLNFFMFVFVIFSLGSCKKDEAAAPSSSIEAPSSKTLKAGTAYSLNNWMSSINGALSLSQLSIPGSHDAGARYEPISGTAKCQNLSIADQLNAGVRFLDIRCRHIGDAFAIHHGSIYQNINFDDVLNACWAFLSANPTETIVMSVKEEYNSSNITRTFEQTFDTYVAKNPSRWNLGASVPTLNSVRGKIVLLRRFSATNTPKGIDASNWSDNTTFNTSNSNASLSIEDYYQASSANNKWTYITNQLTAAKSGSSSTLFMTFTSGYYSIIGIPSITTISNSVNPKLTTYFTSNTSGRFGIIPMDFSDSSRSNLIIATNF